jgi:RNA polymerase sigma-70 factor (ECF subfamily)
MSDRSAEGGPGTGRPPESREDETTRELVIRYRAGDRQALDRIFRRYLPVLRRWAHGRLPSWARDDENTDDLVQETFVRTLQRMAEFEPRRHGGLRSYLRTALRHRVVEELRRVSRRPLPEHSIPETEAAGPSPFQDVVGQEMIHFYEDALGTLSEADRGAVIGRVEMEMSYQELAKALGKPSPDAARMAVARALVRLAKEMHRLAE